MPSSYPAPYNPVGSFDPSFMTNSTGGGIAGTVTATEWNTCIPGSPMQAGANVLANCTGYAQGRMLNIYRAVTGYDPAQTLTHPFISLNVDAGNWANVARSIGLTVVDDPRPASVLVTGSHVAVVESYDEESGRWWVSESGWDTLPAYSYSLSLYKSGTHYYSSYASDPLVTGFILIPDVPPGPGPGPGPEPTPGRKKRWIYYLKNLNNEIY